eukprot:TRINITY_DN48080_c0_g1_i1.p1 TRINITY_DN48080_c0_g1~~TRINITY_DN48080_c0_g1_i1.p1  ORF type:complete len:156 (-),score=20.32 TRINITY_DN48080_c0_g1_i1:17-484(-)
MSCNPSIGGVGKGILVREIDALDGLMGRVTDKSGIMFKVLNQSRGPAVHGPRAQADRALYRQQMQTMINQIPGLSIKEGSVEDLELSTDGKNVQGLRLENGETIATKHVIITTGTFLGGVLHLGPHKRVLGGRVGEIGRAVQQECRDRSRMPSSA